LVEKFAPVLASARCGALLDRFLDEPGCDLLVVVEDERPIGVVGRGAGLAHDPERPVQEIMTRPLAVDAETTIERACLLLLEHAEPAAGLVVVDETRYVGVVSARALLRDRCESHAEHGRYRRFLDLVSHEIRSPMNGVLAVAELLQRQPLSADSQAFVRTILESSQAALRALNDAIELSQAQSGEMTLSAAPVMLRELMDGIQDAWCARAARDGVTLLSAYDGEPDLSVNIDAGRVRQLFDKLIDASLAGAGCGAVEVSLHARREGDGLALTGCVRNTAAGFSADPWAAFLNGPSGGGEPAAVGPGLGVALCRQIVERMGGAISAQTNVGDGVTVTFELHAGEAIAPAAPGEAAAPGVRGAAHVLVVDDNATNRMVAEALCEMFDCTSECAEDGAEAVEAARSGRFDIILMDIRMPRMDGVEATRAIRALPGPAGAVPIIALTANADPEDAKSYMDCGMHSVVEKPIKPDRLLQAINAALSLAPGREAEAA
jgi:CheY-like chemotaxis protein